MNGEREKILGRIREALTLSAPHPHSHTDAPPSRAPVEQPNSFSRWLPHAGETLVEQVEMFRAHSIELRADFRLVASRDELARRLSEIRNREGWEKVGIHRGELTNFARETLKLPVVETDPGYDVRELENCDAGITECDALVAQTGSILVSTRSAGGRALSVLPPHHIVLASRAQLVPDLSAAISVLQKKYAPAMPSFFSFITGPSRTGDIERILVLGAHGPKKLTILCT